TLTGLTQVRIATNCNAYTYADSSDTCNGAVDKFGITLDQLTAWNPVLGRPDGKYCSTQFWAQYDYCVGVDEDSGSNPVISAAPPGTTAAVITGKTWTSLPSDGSPGEYTVNGLNCTGPGEYYPECWQKLNMNDWLPQLYAQEPQCQSSQIVGLIQKFFKDWERTITDALNIASDLITAIVDTIDRRKGPIAGVKPDVGGAIVPDLPRDRIQPILRAYTTFGATSTLAQTGWHAMMLPGVNPQGITNKSTPYPAWAGEDRNKDDLKCTDYNEFYQCSRTQNSAYVLNKSKDEDSSDLLNRILSAEFSTGQLLFEKAAICEIQAVLRTVSTIDQSSIQYTTINKKAGFQFKGPLPGIAPGDYSIVDGSGSGPTYFLPFDGAGLTHLRQQSAYTELLHHPTDVDLWAFTNQGIDFSCISQLDVEIATVWGANWV
ncbi:MAG: hypothetical protein LQ349_001084, partial [Xanthoria aureola]